MKQVFSLLFAVIIFTSLNAQTKSKALVLGTYHMENPGLDKFNMKADDIGTLKRQDEVEAFVNHLASFKPTKICLEYPYAKRQKLNENYAAYLNGKYELRKNEIDQIGFRLAKKLGLKEVFAVDKEAPFEFDTVVTVAQKYQFFSFLEFLGKLPGWLEEENQKLYSKTITQYYQYLNTPENVRKGHGFYLSTAAVGKDDNYAGADLVADWYERNLRIYRNILNIDRKPEDRFFILFGAGHSKILQDLIDDSAGFELVQLKDLK
ncbi:MAG: hypothetical protein HY015_04560 [Bacteroidetes bacterium]|nr:hypothetical protein [Bacteroidota bacterium]MBI3482232.1 hypothetical protein [Bacteroidota bacterium]